LQKELKILAGFIGFVSYDIGKKVLAPPRV
jgi:hypothetical protein